MIYDCDLNKKKLMTIPNTARNRHKKHNTGCQCLLFIANFRYTIYTDELNDR